MSIRNQVTEDGFVSVLAATEAQLVLSVSDAVTTAVVTPGAGALPVGPVVLRVTSGNAAHRVQLSVDHIVLGNALLVVNTSGTAFVLLDPEGQTIATVGANGSCLTTCIDATAGASVWSKLLSA